jgi:hypothetical protein
LYHTVELEQNLSASVLIDLKEMGRSAAQRDLDQFKVVLSSQFLIHKSGMHGKKNSKPLYS